MKKCVVALGTFDGVHLGHQKVIMQALEIARQLNTELKAFTFSDHPREKLTGGHIGLITSVAERERRLRALGVAQVISVPFDSVRALSPEEFLFYLIGQYGAVHFVCGTDFRFGNKGAGDFEAMCAICRRTGTECTCVDFALDRSGNKISSRVIRELIEKGDLPRANALLGKPFVIEGDSRHGKGLARTWGTPTVNLPLPNNLVVPRFGVYAATAVVNGIAYPAVTNIGVRPSFDDGTVPNVETYILEGEFDQIESVGVRPLLFLRPEIKFDDTKSLQLQIEKDIQNAKAALYNKAGGAV